MTEGNMLRQYLATPRVFLCSSCHCHLASQDDLISKSFQGRHGKAYLFHSAVNTTLGPKEERALITGVHTVADVFCSGCKTLIGWKYENASDPSQKYKIGKVIIEKAKIIKDNGWV